MFLQMSYLGRQLFGAFEKAPPPPPPAGVLYIYLTPVVYFLRAIEFKKMAQNHYGKSPLNFYLVLKHIYKGFISLKK